MKPIHRHRSSVLLCGLIVGSTLANIGRVRADFTFSLPTNLGPTVNTADGESGPSISADGLSLYFSGVWPPFRPGGYGAADLWVTTRATTHHAWRRPVNLGSVVNSTAYDQEPAISADGLSLYFCSDRPGGYGGVDIWVTTRETTESDWNTPVNLGPEVNSPSDDGEPSISFDGLTLFFDSDRSGGFGDFDLYKATRATADDDWTSPVNVGPEVNSSGLERGPSLSADGLMLFFCSGRLGPHDLWMATRATVLDPWRPAVQVGPEVDSPAHDVTPSISFDGRTLYYQSSRSGGFGSYDLWQASILPVVDFNNSGRVDFRDFARLAQHWRRSEPSVDISPPVGNSLVDLRDVAAFSEHWLAEDEEQVLIQWLGHASVKIWMKKTVVYVDPRNLEDAPHDATVVCVTHSHSDHYAPADINKVSKGDTVFIGPPDVVAAYGRGEALAPGETFTRSGVSITGVPAYNINKTNHPKANNWLGYILEIGSKRIYVAGDTDLTPEMKALEDIDVAIVPAGGSYTMNAAEAAEATKYIQPQLAIPYHWGEIVGTLKDAQQFARLAACNAKVMKVAEVLCSCDWSREFSLVAHWALDESEGNTVSDMLVLSDAILNGAPHWQPASGKIGGAVQFDGVENYIETGSVLNPADGPFGVFAWVKAEVPGVIVSQTNGANWLLADASTGYLGTELKGSSRSSAPLWSQMIVTDGDWHRVGLTWDGAVRILYVDDVEVARDVETTMKGSNKGLYVGVAGDLDPGTFFSGLVDDVRVYSRAVTP